MLDQAKLRAEMARHGHTLESLAKETGLSVTGLHKILHGKVDSRVSSLGAIASALKKQPGYFFAPDVANSAKRAAR